jgi:hypothetical protein
MPNIGVILPVAARGRAEIPIIVTGSMKLSAGIPHAAIQAQV